MKKSIYSIIFLGISFIITGVSYAQQLKSLAPSKSTEPTYHSRRTHVNPEFCGTDYFHEQRMQNDSEYRARHEQMITLVQQVQLQKNPVNGIYQVPVVVHVMHKGEAVGVGTNISDDDVKRGIQNLNNFWRKVAGSNGDGSGVDMEIEFTLAIQDEGGNCTDGIDRVDMSGVTAYVNNGVNRQNATGIDDYDAGGGINSLKEYSIWDPTEFYNVWIVDEIDNANCFTGGSYTAGYAYYASSHGQPYDGSVVLICSYLDESSDTWAHEMGHAFNLPHTFDGDNNGANCGDDGIFDTPSHVRTSSIDPSIYFDCSNTDANTCDAAFNEEINPDNGFTRNSGTHQDHMHNYMDYTGCSSEFTGGQRTVAKSAMTGARGSFLSGYALTPPLPATVDFVAAASVACLGSSVYFEDQSTCTPNTYTNTGYTGITFSWTFDNGVDVPYTSTDQNPTITFNNAGTYDVTLEITNPQGTTNQTKTDYISVANAPVAACSPTTGNTGNYGLAITNVAFNTISNATGTTNAAYTNFTCSHNTVIDAGTPYNLSVDYSAGSGFTEFAEVWIDWDNSGTFESSNSDGIDEKVLSGSTPDGTTDNISTSITAPASAPLDTLLRMRVIGNANSAPSLCGNNFVGDCEDYGIYVQSVVACSEPDVPTVSGTNTICSGTNTTLSINTGALNDATNWQWYTGSCGGTTAGSGTSINVSPSVTTTYYVRGEGGCTTPGACGSIIVTVNSVDVSTTNSTDETCAGNDGTATVTPSAGSGNYAYSWDTAPVQTTATATGLAAATYNVVVTDNITTCVASTNVIVNDACVGSAPVADFSANQTSVCEGTTINFTDLSTNTPTGWSWSFPGGSPASSTNQNPSVTYNSGGVYQVVLTANNGFGSDDETKVGYITVNVCGTTSVKPKFAKTYTAYTQKVACYKVANAQEYEFKFTPSGGGADIIYNRQLNDPSFLLGWVSGLSDGTTYNVRVRAKVGGAFGSYGISRQITTPGSSTQTQIKPVYCGTTYINYADLLVCYPVSNAQEYDFRFTPVGGGADGSYIGGSNSILLSWATGLLDGTTYNVSVRVKVGGSYGGYGSSCQITTPSDANLTMLKSNYCGVTFGSYGDKITCYPLSGAVAYEWEFTPAGGGASILYSGPYNSINLNVVETLAVSTTYDVRIRPDFGAGFTSFGNACQITTPASMGMEAGGATARMINTEEAIKETNLSNLVIYPNPNQGEYLYVELQEVGEGSELLITDIYGKQVKHMFLNSEDSNYHVTVKFDNKLEAGFYLVTVISNGQPVTKKLIVK